MAVYGDRLLVVNLQFARRKSGEIPELPFTVSGTEIPRWRTVAQSARPRPTYISGVS